MQQLRALPVKKYAGLDIDSMITFECNYCFCSSCFILHFQRNELKDYFDGDL